MANNLGQDPFPFFGPLVAILDFAGNVALGNVALQAVSQWPRGVAGGEPVAPAQLGGMTLVDFLRALARL